MVLPELLGGVLAGHALEDLGAARVLVDKLCGVKSASGHGMGSCILGEEGGKKGERRKEGKGERGKEGSTSHVVHVRVDDDVQALCAVVLCDIRRGELLRHDGICTGVYGFKNSRFNQESKWSKSGIYKL